jgi:hypothetical protein
MKDSSMEDKLDQVLDRVIDWLKYEEAKNAALVTLDGVGLGVILQWLGMQSGQKLSVLLRTSQAALLLSSIVAMSTQTSGSQAATSAAGTAVATAP